MSIDRGNFRMAIDLLQTYNDGLGTSKDPLTVNGGVQFTDGDGSGEIDVMYGAYQTALADGANTTLDLADGTLTDRFGRGVEFDTIKGLYIKNNFAAGELHVGAAASTPVTGLVDVDATGLLVIQPGGEIMLLFGASGIDVETNCHLKLEHDGSGAAAGSFDIVIVGVGDYS